ncbi:MAG: magnesium transporter [Clostridium sp.]|nr:magnesium transporter [Clostridiaceae bacterium]MDD6073170.1 magnesium transporter [Clostridium sp.]MDY5485001.1 magnesium transporter [Clostridium sp.]
MNREKDNISIPAVNTQHPDYKNEIVEIIRSNLTPKLTREKISGYHENDIAAALELLKKDERSKLYSILDIQTLADVLEYSEERDVYIGELAIRRQVEVLEQLEISLTVDYLRQLDKTKRNLLIGLMEAGTRKEIAFSSSFDEDEIGSRMTTNYISIRNGSSVRQAMRDLIDQAAENDNISTIYVVDEDDTLFGAVDLKDLIIARETTALEEIVMTSYPYVYAEEEIDDCIERIKDYSEDSIPVLDEENRLKGVLTAPVIAQLVHDVLGDDYAKLGGLTAEEDLEEPLHKSVAKRLPWLVVLLVLGMLVSSVVGLFETVVAQLALIVCFQSLVLDMAGNVGTQSLAVTIRVLMDEEISGKQKLYLVTKEARVGLLNGAILGGLSFLVIGGYLFLLKGQPPILAFGVSACTGIALLVSMLLSSVAGTSIPILFKKMNVDPAVASGPLITTVNDLVAVVTYYGLAWLLLLHVMHL